MKKVLKTLLVVMVLAVVLTAFSGCELLDKIKGLLPSSECEHTGGTATCAAQAICEKCGEPYGEKLAHTPQTIMEIHPTCTEAGKTEGSKCSVCGEIIVAPVEVAATGHDYYVEGCVKTCLNCGDVVGEHTWADATCTAPKTCTVCQKTDGKANGHKGGTATCESKAVCETCGEEYGELAKHTEVDMDNVPATCGKDGSEGGKKCSVCDTITVQPTVVPATGEHKGGTATCKDKAVCESCGQPYGELGDHKGGEATCQSKAVCDTCHEEYGELGDHKGGEATCQNKAVCDTCKEEYGEIGSHKGGTATCEKLAVCDTCKEEYGKLLPHDHNGTNGVCSMCGAFVFDGDTDLKDYGKNEAIADSTTFVNGLITLVGNAKRSNSGNYSIELTKRGGSYFTFTIPEGMIANVKLVVSSTGGSNTSDFGIFDADGNAMENAEDTYTIKGSDETAFNYALTAGTYKIMSPDGGDNSNRGVRVFEVKVDLCAVKEIADLGTLEDGTKVQFTGTVVKIDEAWNTKFNNMTVTVSDGNGNTFYVYRLATKVELCDTVTITGKIGSYKDSKQIAAGATAVIGEKNHIYAPATCTEPATCPCGQTTGEAKGHNYGENGVCECGAKEGVVTKTESVVIKATTGTSGTKSLSWASENFNFLAEQADSATTIRTSDSGHYRAYKGSTFTISSNNGQKIQKIVITTTEGSYNIASASYVTTSGVTVTCSGTTCTIVVNDGVELTEVALKAVEQFRVSNIEITYVD